MVLNMRARNGFTLVEIMVVVAIIGALVSIAIPNFMRSRERSTKTVCANNMRQIDAAKEQWALEALQGQGATVVTSDVDSYLKGSTSPKCPQKGTYDYGTIGTKPSCSIAVHTGIY